MSKRVTVVMHDDIYRKLRLIQSNMIKKDTKNVSFSLVVSLALAKGLSKRS